MMKKNYMQMDLKIVDFDDCDIICTSSGTSSDLEGDNAVPDWW